MDIVSFLNNHSSNFVHFAWTMLLQSSLLILILLALDLLLRRKVRAVFRYCLWMLLLVKLVLPVGLALPYSPAYWASSLLPETNQVAPETPVKVTPQQADTIASQYGLKHLPPTPKVLGRPVRATVPTITDDGTYMPPVTLAELESAAVDTANQTTPIIWQSFAALGWLVAVLLMLGLLIQRLFFVKSLIRQSKLADGNLLSQLKQCASKMDMRRKVDIRISPNASSPSVCGLIQPVILMPDNLSDHLSKNQIDAILMHELAHIKRGDLWVNFIQALLQIAYFYNPLLWLANSAIRRIREQAVDEMVLVAMEDRAEDYPETLLNVSKLVWSKPMLSLRLIGVVESKSALTSRIKHILSRPFPKSAKLGWFGLFMIIAFATVALPMANRTMKEKKLRKFIKATEDGSWVELVAINNYNGKTGWWRPDGTIYDGQFEISDKNNYPTKHSGYWFVYKTGSLERSLFSAKGSRQASGITVVKPDNSFQGFRAHIKPSYKSTSVTISVLEHTWWNIGGFNGRGMVNLNHKGKDIILSPAVKLADGGISVTVSDELSHEYGRQLIVLKHNGKGSLAKEVANLTINNNLHSSTFEAKDIELEEIKKIEFLVQKYQKLTFNGVKLLPDFKVTAPPAEYIGHWKGQAKIIVNWTKQKNLPIDIKIHSDGTVEGKVGDAELVNGKLVKKSWVYTKVFQHENPYRIIGDLQGEIIKSENIQRDSIHISIRVEDDKIDGGLGTSGTKTGSKDKMILSAMDVSLTRVDSDKTDSNLTAKSINDRQHVQLVIDGSYIVSGRVYTKTGGDPVAATVTLWHGGDGKTQTTQTNADGDYIFKNVTPSKYDYVLNTKNPPGTGTDWNIFKVTDKNIEKDLYFALPQSISGIVRDTITSELVAGVEINFSTDNGRNSTSIQTDAFGKFRLYINQSEVTVRCRGTEDRYYPKKDNMEDYRKIFELAAGQNIEGIVFKVISATKFTGQVLYPDGKPAANVQVNVEVWWTDGKNIPHSYAGAFGVGSVRQFTTDPNGKFTGYLRYPDSTGDYRHPNIDLSATVSLPKLSLSGIADAKIATTSTETLSLKIVLDKTASTTVTGPFEELDY